VLALVNSSYGAIAAGAPERARPQLEEALELTRELGEPPSTVSVLQLLAWEAHLAGEPARARRFLRDALELLRGGGRESHLADVLSEAAVELAATHPRTAARLLATADAGAPARGTPARQRYDAVRERLESCPPLTPDEAIAEAIASLDAP
jgi:Tetratricopeptide repeat